MNKTKTKLAKYTFDKDVYNNICLSYIKKYKKPEEWRIVVIDGIITKYKVSNYGRVIDTNKDRSPTIYKHFNHYGTTITVKKGLYRYYGIYRLVAMMFIPIPKKYEEMGYTIADLVVDHIRDGDKDNFDDNTIWNLQWLTYRENTSKASKCGYREPFQSGFREELDKMILDDYTNDLIYSICKSKYNYVKKDIKGMIQVRRRRLNKKLKEHYEHDKDFVKEIDRLLLDGLSNSEIIKKLNMPTDTRSSERLLQYRRTVLQKPSQCSKYFDNETNKFLNTLIEAGFKTNEIISKLGIEDIDPETLKKIKCTIRARRRYFKNKNYKFND